MTFTQSVDTIPKDGTPDSRSQNPCGGKIIYHQREYQQRLRESRRDMARPELQENDGLCAPYEHQFTCNPSTRLSKSLESTEGCVEDAHYHSMPDEKETELSDQKQRRYSIKKNELRKTSSCMLKGYELPIPKEANVHDNERINKIDQDLLQMIQKVGNICKSFNIRRRGPKAIHTKKSPSHKRNNKSVFMLIIKDEDQSLYLEPKPKVKHRKLKKGSGLVKDLKFSLKRAKQWTIIQQGDHIKEMKKRKRNRERKMKSDVIKSLKRNWKNTNITEKELDQDGKKKSLQYSKLQSLVRKWHTQPDKLCVQVYPVSRSLDPYFQSLENENSRPVAPPMQFEWLRLNSFANSSGSMQVRPIFLARAGFYHTGLGDEVKCYSCGLTYRNWRFGDDPNRLHRTLSPNCRHMAGNDDTNIPIPREDRTVPTFQTQERAVSHAEGLDSCPQPENPSLPSQEISHPTNVIAAAALPRNITQSTENMFVNPDRILPHVRSPDGNIQVNSERQHYRQESSDYQQGQDNTGQTNAYNPNTLSTTNRPNDHQTQVQTGMPTINHRTPNGPNQTSQHGMVNGSCRQNVASQGTPQRTSTDVSTSTMRKLAPLGVNFDKPKYPAYAVLTVRMSSYSGWSASQTPNQMAEAGFVYAGYADYTRCFFCGGGLRNWEKGDDPWIEHARWFPRCAYLRQNKGDAFIQLVHEQLEKEENTTNTNQTTELAGLNSGDQGQTNDMEEIRSLPAYQSLIENGYDPKKINMAIRNLRKKGETIESTAVVEEIYRLEDTGDHGIDDVTNVMHDDISDNTKPGANTFDENIRDPNNQEMKEILNLVEENRRLKKQKMCRICEEEDASIAFLPCAHLVCCPVCSQAVRKCPVCGQIIQGTVKTWFG